MKGVLVVVVHPPTFPSTKGSQYTMAVFGRAGTYGRSRKRQHASPLARVSQEVRQLRHYGRDPQHCCLTSPAIIIDQGYFLQFHWVSGTSRVPMEMFREGPVTQCAQCGATIIAPEWSEHRSDRCVRNVWSCEACGYQFESTVYFSAPKIQPDSKVEENERAS